MGQALYQYNGLIHVHSTYSDGQKSIKEIAEIANELDVDFLFITDHNTMQGKLDAHEGWYGKLLLGIGMELNDEKDENHLLALGLNQPVNHRVSAHEYACKVRDQGGIGIIAHPDENRKHIADYPPYPWTIWESDCFQGIEIWNQMSEWMEGLTHWNKYWRVLHPRRSIIAPKRQTLQRWDAISQTRKLVGIGGVDAHGYIHRLLGMFSLRIFRYKVSFRTIRTHVLTSEPLPKNDYKKALHLVLDAIRSARCYVSHRYLGSAHDFRFTASNPNGTAQMGEELSMADENTLIVHNPEPALSRLIHNGRLISKMEGSELKFKVDRPGVYRIETYKNGKAWIFSNHIRLNS